MSQRSWQNGQGALEETKRVARLLDMIVRISTRPKMWTRRALAQAFEISERRIQEDLEILVHRLHLPLGHCRTGYYFTNHRPLGAVSFAFGEAVALLLAASVARATAGVGSAELAAALTRLKEAFPVELRGLLDALEPAGGTSSIDRRRQHLLELLQEAIATRSSVEMRYATASRGDAESEREVDPYALVPYVRSFHLVGYCHRREEVRIFKVDRVQGLRLTGRRFEVPEDFDLEEYLGGSWGLLRGAGRAPELVEIRFTRQAGRWVSEERWHPSQRIEWRADGSMLFSARLGVTPAFVRWVLYYGGEAEVLRPAWLREAVVQEAGAVLARYGESNATGRWAPAGGEAATEEAGC